MSDHGNGGEVFAASQILTGFSGGDVMTLIGSSNTRVELLSLRMQLTSTSTAPLAQSAAVEIYRGTTSTGGGGATILPTNLQPWARAAAVTVLGQPSAGNSTASAARIDAGGFSVGEGDYCYEPCPKPILSASQNMHIRTSAWSTAATLNLAMTLTFREIGKLPL